MPAFAWAIGNIVVFALRKTLLPSFLHVLYPRIPAVRGDALYAIAIGIFFDYLDYFLYFLLVVQGCG
jgi:hypothetical protein